LTSILAYNFSWELQVRLSLDTPVAGKIPCF
jgi:hypothetical protein